MTAAPTTPDPARLEDVPRLGFSPGDEDVRIVVGDCVYYVRVVGRFQSLRGGGSGGRTLSVPTVSSCGDGVEGLVAAVLLWPVLVLLSVVLPEALRRTAGKLPRTTRRRVGILCFSRAHRWDASGVRLLHRERAVDHDTALARVAALADEVRAGKWPHPSPGR